VPSVGVLLKVEPSDATLVERTRAGDLEAFARLVARYQGRYLRYARNMLGSIEDAEEAVQDAFVRAYRGLDGLDPERFPAWAFRILVNRCRTAFRRQERRRQMFAKWDDAAETHVAADDRAIPAVGWREELDRALAALPVEQREAFLLKHGDDLSYAEMRDLTGASVPALKMRVSRACDRLRDLLDGAVP
jgi:RNA polymerase sigma-70 factor, ECF subfamily